MIFLRNFSRPAGRFFLVTLVVAVVVGLVGFEKLAKKARSYQLVTQRTQLTALAQEFFAGDKKTHG